MAIHMVAVLLSVVTVLSVIATPTEPRGLERRLGGRFFVSVNGVHDYCMLMPTNPHTTIAESQAPFGVWSRCDPAATKTQAQMLMPSDFWSKVAFKSGDKTGKRFAQLTGCIRPHTLDRLVPTDPGGQYTESQSGEIECVGYNHFVEIVEPAKKRACIKCCDDPADCQKSSKVHPHCPKVIPGKYFNCA